MILTWPRSPHSLSTAYRLGEDRIGQRKICVDVQCPSRRQPGAESVRDDGNEQSRPGDNISYFNLAVELILATRVALYISEQC